MRRADAPGLQHRATLKQSEGICAVSFGLWPQRRVKLERIEIARAVVSPFVFAFRGGSGNSRA